VRAKYTAPELALRRELQKQLKNAGSEIARGRLRESLQRIRNAALARANERAKRKADREAEASRPKRENFATDSEFADALELFRLDLSEKAANRVLNSGRSSLRARIQAEHKLEEIAFRRLKLTGSDSGLTASQPHTGKSQTPALGSWTFSTSEPTLDPANLSDQDLCKKRFLLSLGKPDLLATSEEFIALNQEFERRQNSKPRGLQPAAMYFDFESKSFVPADEYVARRKARFE
jgi:hypothetical protein